MPGANATLLSYGPAIEVDLSNNEVNLTSAASAGHRITANVSIAAMNAAFKWSRLVNAKRPVGAYDDLSANAPSGLGEAIEAGLNGDIVDTDASALDFSTDTPQDARVTDLNGTDRLVAAYILYKGYGSSAFDTDGVVLNPEDLSGMAKTSEVRKAILAALASDSGSVNKMFQDLIAADPTRFFDQSGKQIGGIFETNTDVQGSGNWGFVAGDRVELKLVFKFSEDVTVYDADGAAKKVISGKVLANPAATPAVLAKDGESFSLRLQLEVS